MSQRDEYLFLLYFGASPRSALGRSVRRAYRDLSRTLHGLSESTQTRLREDAAGLLESRIQELLDRREPVPQDAFDDWHQNVTRELCAFYRRRRFPAFSVGQAQKWINMGVKYALTFGEEHVAGVTTLSSSAHAPIDNIVLTELALRGCPRLAVRWSRLRDYATYMDVQRWIRDAFPDEAPLAVESRWFVAGMKRRGAATPWALATVDASQDHFELRYGSAENASWDEWLPVARVGQPDPGSFAVDLLMTRGDPASIRIMDATVRELDFYLIEQAEQADETWKYARYHCTTASNVYSDVHWSFFPRLTPSEALRRRHPRLLRRRASTPERS